MTRFGCVGFSTNACGFSVPQVRQFCLCTYLPRSKWASFEKMIFFAKIGIFYKLIAGSLSEAKTHWMVNWLQPLNQLNFVWRHTKIFMQNSSQLLRTTVNLCWWRFTHPFCHNSNILEGMQCFWLFTLWFIDEDANFFHFFSQDNEHTELTVLLFFQNPYAIFAYILQHYHDFQSKVAIFPSVVQAQARTNYLSNQTWAKLYNSRKKHLLKKKTLDGGPYGIFKQNLIEFLSKMLLLCFSL